MPVAVGLYPAAFNWASAGDFHLLPTDVAAPNAYPVVATVFVLMPKARTPNPRTQAALDFFRWALERGAKNAAQLGYVPLPDPLVAHIKSYWLKNFSTGA